MNRREFLAASAAVAIAPVAAAEVATFVPQRVVDVATNEVATRAYAFNQKPLELVIEYPDGRRRRFVCEDQRMVEVNAAGQRLT